MQGHTFSLILFISMIVLILLVTIDSWDSPVSSYFARDHSYQEEICFYSPLINCPTQGKSNIYNNYLINVGLFHTLIAM